MGCGFGGEGRPKVLVCFKGTACPQHGGDIICFCSFELLASSSRYDRQYGPVIDLKPWKGQRDCPVCGSECSESSGSVMSPALSTRARGTGPS